MAEVIDKSYHQETGELQQFTVIREDGQPDLVKATAENILLWDPEDVLPFENGLHDFLHGNHALVLSESEPKIMVAPTSNDYCYILRVDGSTVETTPNQAEDVLTAIKDAAVEKDFEGIIDVYDTIRANQVRRPVMNALMHTFEKSERISEHPRGWIVDDFYIVNWEASMYVKHDDPDEPDYQRGGGGVTQIERDAEFVELSVNRDIEPVEVTIGDEDYRLTEREMLFIAKVKWLLNRREQHPDLPFWKRADRYASVDWRTGEPEDGQE